MRKQLFITIELENEAFNTPRKAAREVKRILETWMRVNTGIKHLHERNLIDVNGNRVGFVKIMEDE